MEEEISGREMSLVFLPELKGKGLEAFACIPPPIPPPPFVGNGEEAKVSRGGRLSEERVDEVGPPPRTVRMEGTTSAAGEDGTAVGVMGDVGGGPWCRVGTTAG